jgi:asparagine synthase (glutamine-hydrolysing)
MPGLVGFAGLEAAASVREEWLHGMRDAITHRPFYVLDPLFARDRICATRVHLGPCQQDPQPFSLGGRHVWFDGEFSNQHELRQRLGGVAESDPAILLGLLGECAEQGDFSLLAKIDGIFAAVVYDEAQGRLQLISDRYGMRHLYFGMVQGGICWSSEQKAFAAGPGRGASIDAAAARQFLDSGHLHGESSWFADVELLSAGTVLEFDIASRSRRQRRYWSWDSIRPALGPFDERELCDEIARRLRTAVSRRSSAGERVGLRLDGRLESRVLLAALPDRVRPLHVVSESCAGLDDERALRQRGAEHHVFESGSEGWVAARLDAVWWTDGQLNLLHMPGPETFEAERSLYDFGLSGLLGDVVAGSAPTPAAGSARIDDQARRAFIQQARLAQVFLEQRLAFLSNDLLELLFSLPPELRRDARIYRQALASGFGDELPELSRSAPLTGRFSSLRRRAGSIVGRFRPRVHAGGEGASQPADVASWIRSPGNREVFEQRLLASDAAVLEWCEPGEVARLWRSHLAGEDHAEGLGRLLTLELWAGRLARPQPGAPG